VNIDPALRNQILTQLTQGELVPYLGPGVLKGVVAKDNQQPIPADSESLILAMNDGVPMAPRLMYEFPRAAMNLENKKGRSYVERFLTRTYGERKWTRSAFHQWLSEMPLPYLIDTNRDTQMQELWSGKPHNLIVGAARIAGTPFRYDLYENQNGSYQPRTIESINTELPVLFKPLGTPTPKASYIASDADFVDYITELMGGFAIPFWVKQMRLNKRYLLLGLRLNRDTERMILNDLLYSSAKPAGWALIPDANDKEKRFCARLNLEVINADCAELMAPAQVAEAV
jgi:hypothetical protein